MDPWDFEPVADSFFDFGWADYIVPPALEGPSSSPRSSAPSYETPWWADSINRAIERASQVATVNAAGYPQYPQFPAQTVPQTVPQIYPTGTVPTVQQQQGAGINLSNTTLMLIVGGALLFMLGKRGR